MNKQMIFRCLANALSGALMILGLQGGGALAENTVLRDDFANEKLTGWELSTSVPANGEHAFEEDGLTLKHRGMCKLTLKTATAVPMRHKLIFEFREGSGDGLRWDVQYVKGNSKYDGLPFVAYQTERDGRFGLWTRSEQGWISHLPGVSALGLRDVIAGIQPGTWYRVLCQNDDDSTLVRIWSLPDEAIIYEKIARHDSVQTIMDVDSEGYIAFSLQGYQPRKDKSGLTIRNVSVTSMGARILEEVEEARLLQETAHVAAPSGMGKQEVAIKAPSLLQFEVEASGIWHAGCSNWKLVQGFSDGTHATPYLSPFLTIGPFRAFGLNKGVRYRFSIGFTEDEDYIRIEQADTGELFSKFVIPHRATQETTFVLRDEISEVQIDKVVQAVMDDMAGPVGEKPALPNGYELLFEDDFRGNLGKWGAPHVTTGGFLRLERFRHWTESGILEIPYLSASDFILEAEVYQSEGPNGFGILFRKDPNDDTAFCMFKANTKRSSSFAEGFSFDNGNNIPTPLEIGTTLGGMLQPRKWNTVKIVADGPTVTGYINGFKSAQHEHKPAEGGFSLSVDVGTELYVRSLRVYAKKDSRFCYEPKGKEVTEPKLTSVSEPFPVVPRQTPKANIFIDAEGREHFYIVEGDNLLYDGQLYSPVKNSDGQYFVRYEPEKWPKAVYESLIERDGSTLAKIKQYGLTYQIVTTQISTYIDCTKEDSGFSEDSGLGGASRVMEIDGVEYRVTSARKSKDNYFFYSAAFPKLGYPYIMVYQVPNDRFRITSICPLPPETGSAGVVSGGPFPVDRKSYNMMHLFFPMQEKYEFCVYHPRITKDWSDDAGGAVANIWFLLIEDSLHNLQPLVKEKHGVPSRKIGTLDQTPVFTRALYGVHAKATDKVDKHQLAMANFINYAKFSGANLVNFYFLGNDWALDTMAHYPSKIYAGILPLTYDYLEQFLTVADEKGISTYPRIATFAASEMYRAKTVGEPDALVLDKNGDYVSIFTNRIWNPLHPKVKALYLDTVEELARKTAPYRSVRGICINVGAAGCFASGEVGYNPDMIEQFRNDTGIDVPRPEKGTPYEWMKENCWEAWLEWRCQKIKDMHCLMRDRITAVRPDLKLQIKFNVLSFNGSAGQSADAQVRRLREMGIDLSMYRGTGIEWAGGYVYHDKYLYYPEPDRSVDLKSLILPSEARKAMVDIVSYYELPAVLPKLSPRYVGWLAAVNLTPVGRHVLELPVMDLRINDVQHVEFMRWEKAIAQMEHLLRRFGAAFRALPAVESMEFQGQVEVLSGPADDAALAIRWYEDRLMVLNDSPDPKTVKLTFEQGLSKNEQVKELGWNRVLAQGPVPHIIVEIDLQPFDVQALLIEEQLQ